MPNTAHVWVDPVCPWTWLSTKWLREVESVRDVRADFHVMSLSVLNEGRADVSDFYRDGVARWWGPVRVVAGAARTAGDDVIRPLYEQLAVRIHERDEPYGPALYEAALAEVGLPVELASAADGTEHDDEVRARHRRAALVPADAELGVPTLHLPGPDGAPVALHGPVVNPAPKGKTAGRLWDALLVLAQTRGFSEVKRSRAAEPDLS